MDFVALIIQLNLFGVLQVLTKAEEGKLQQSVVSVRFSDLVSIRSMRMNMMVPTQNHNTYINYNIH